MKSYFTDEGGLRSMKESIIRSLIGTIVMGSIVFTLFGCGDKNDVSTIDLNIDVDSEISKDTEPPANGADSENESGTEAGAGTVASDGDVVSSGPYGEITMSIAEGWTGKPFGTYENEAHIQEYGIILQKEGEDSQAYLLYYPTFGVCGTGMTFENIEIAGKPANMGYENGSSFWGYVSMTDNMEGLVLLMENIPEEWWNSNREELLGMLDTVRLDAEKKTGVVEVYSDDSYNEEIGVKMRINKLSKTGATIEFVDVDDSKNQELFFGEEYYIEKKTENGWEQAKEVELMFIDIAYVVPAGESAVIDVDWSGSYGELEPGEYRISKGVSGKTLRAYFTVN